MEIIAKYIHGSEDSLDIDTYYIVDKVPVFQEAKEFCDSIRDENANLLSLDDNGHVNACYKGTIDECNNSLFITYKFHPQKYPLLILSMVTRDTNLKCIRAVRILLSHLSRTQYRSIVKDALKMSMFHRIATLEYIDFKTVNFDNLGHSQSGKDILKVFAFQIGQTLALLDNIELYTKSSVALAYPLLKPFLYRETADISVLNEYKNDLCQQISELINMSDDKTVIFKNNRCYNLKTEKLQ